MLEEKLRHRENFWTALAQWRDANRNQVQSEEKILSENLALDRFCERNTGQSNDPRIQLDRLVPPEPVKLFRLDDVQQLGLDGEIHAGDFIEDRSSALRQVELPDFPGNRACECAAFVSE